MQSLFQLAKSWINIPFRWHGYDKFGCDCFGLIIGILHENHIISNDDFEFFKHQKYGNNLSKIDLNQMLEFLLLYFDESLNLSESDLLWIQCKNSPIHFVIFEKNKLIQEAKMIHITQEIGKVFMCNFDEKLKIQKMFKLKSN